jgi:hypothetical protein
MQQFPRYYGLDIYMDKGEGFTINGHRIYALGKSSLVVIGRKSKVNELKKVI